MTDPPFAITVLFGVATLFTAVNGAWLLVSPKTYQRWFNMWNPGARGRDPWRGRGDPIVIRFFATLQLLAAAFMAKLLLSAFFR